MGRSRLPLPDAETSLRGGRLEGRVRLSIAITCIAALAAPCVAVRAAGDITAAALVLAVTAAYLVVRATFAVREMRDPEMRVLGRAFAPLGAMLGAGVALRCAWLAAETAHGLPRVVLAVGALLLGGGPLGVSDRRRGRVELRLGGWSVPWLRRCWSVRELASAGLRASYRNEEGGPVPVWTFVVVPLASLRGVALGALQPSHRGALVDLCQHIGVERVDLDASSG